MWGGLCPATKRNGSSKLQAKEALGIGSNHDSSRSPHRDARRKDYTPQWGQVDLAKRVLTVGGQDGIGDRAPDPYEPRSFGERGRNRTFNLVIKSRAKPVAHVCS